MFNFFKKKVQIPKEMPIWRKGDVSIKIKDYPHCPGLQFGVSIYLKNQESSLDTSLSYADALALFNNAKRKASKEISILIDRKSMAVFFCDINKVSSAARNDIMNDYQ